VTSAVTSTLTAMRTAFGSSTRIFVVIPLNEQQDTAIRAGVTAAADPKVYVIDPGTQYLNTVFSGASSTWASPDGLHLDSTHQALYTAFVLQQVQQILDTTSSAVGGQVTIGGTAALN
jgi:hypothetical protein